MASRGVRFVLVRPRDPNNIGAAARAMANFGLRDLAVVDPYPPVWREARSAVGAAELLRAARSCGLDEALRGAVLVLGTCGGRRRLSRPVVELPALAAYLARRPVRGGGLAVLFGNEKTGLTGEQLGRCHALLRIPTDPRTPSMNLGQAAALVAYELSRPLERLPGEEPRFDPAPAEQTEAVVRAFLGACESSGYMQGVPEAARARRAREALLRLRPCRKDAGLLLAMLRRVGGGGT